MQVSGNSRHTPRTPAIMPQQAVCGCCLTIPSKAKPVPHICVIFSSFPFLVISLVSCLFAFTCGPELYPVQLSRSWAFSDTEAPFVILPQLWAKHSGCYILFCMAFHILSCLVTSRHNPVFSLLGRYWITHVE